jgi:hypothetical protein
MKKIFFIILCLFLLIVPSMALNTFTVSVIDKSDNYIEWGWDNATNATLIYVDGHPSLIDFDREKGDFILSNLNGMEKHSITIYNDTFVGYNLTTTNPSNQDKINSTFLMWELFILGAFFRAIGFYGVPLISLIGSVIGLFGLVNNSTNGSFIIDVLYVILMIAGIILVKGEI